MKKASVQAVAFMRGAAPFSIGMKSWTADEKGLRTAGGVRAAGVARFSSNEVTRPPSRPGGGRRQRPRNNERSADAQPRGDR